MSHKRYARMPIEQCEWNDGRHAPEIVSAYIEYIQGLAKETCDVLDATGSKSSESFPTGARQNLRRFNKTTRAYQKSKTSTFRYSELKDDGPPVTIFIVSDSSRIEALKKISGLNQWCMLQELKRHPNHKKPVYVELDEASNNYVRGLDDLMTYGRGSGIRLHIVIQNLPAFKKAYGPEALDTLLSEAEIKLFLPSQRELDTLNKLEQSYLGQQSYVATGRSGSIGHPDYWLDNTNYSEDSKALMTADEVRRTDKGILIIRRCRPCLVDLPPVAAIDPFRDQIAIDPYHDKPFRLPIQLRINRDGLRPGRLWRWVRDRFRKSPHSNHKRKRRYERLSSIAFTVSRLVSVWWVFALLAFFLSSASPHVLWSYSSERRAFGPDYQFNCAYLGASGLAYPDVRGRCPLFLILDSDRRRVM
ncbi:TraM recognition domain-containing protein [uncultured Roseibium sp.]|uniref:type IV secretory system conjugative DNA transfer family protein n=1 Tax=uncultured Roseibium sp. TaxID=1936171 RepID=UPI002636BA9E|nr:TraM recognition domain-containing protein [uncultured Roseibium sp.]